MKKLVPHTFPLALAIITAFSGCSSKSDDPSVPTPTGPWDIKIITTPHGLNSQVGPDGNPGFNLRAAYKAQGATFYRYQSMGNTSRADTISKQQARNNKPYQLSVSLAFGSILQTNNPVQVDAGISLTSDIYINGRKVQTLVLDRNAGYLPWTELGGSTNTAQSVTTTVDLSNY